MAGTVHELEQKDLFWQVQSEAAKAAQQLVDQAHLRQGQIVVVGCSTSEVVGKRVGSWSTPEIAQAIFNGLHSVFAPQPKAGSSFATAAYNSFRHPVALEEIQADAGLDIGGTLIGMHLKKVAVPVRLDQNHIGSAIVLAARVRPKFIGGERAIYDESLKDGYPDFE